VKELLGSGAPEGQIERSTGLRGQRLRAAIGQSKMYAVSDFRRFLHSAATLDVALKSSRAFPAGMFDAFVLEMCTRRS
jgi:hypothetical protein